MGISLNSEHRAAAAEHVAVAELWALFSMWASVGGQHGAMTGLAGRPAVPL